MGGPRKVPIGRRISEFPGGSFNLLVEEWYRQRSRLDRDTKRGRGPGQTLIVKALNTTGDALNYGDCVAIEGLATAFEDLDNQNYRRPILKALYHTSDLNHAIMGVALKPVTDNQPGPFIIAGAAWIRCNFTSGDHHFAKLPDDQSDSVAESATSGYPILDSDEVPDDEYLPMELWALVLLGGGSAAADSSIVMMIVTTAADAATGDELEVIA